MSLAIWVIVAMASSTFASYTYLSYVHDPSDEWSMPPFLFASLALLLFPVALVWAIAVHLSRG